MLKTIRRKWRKSISVCMVVCILFLFTQKTYANNFTATVSTPLGNSVDVDVRSEIFKNPDQKQYAEDYFRDIYSNLNVQYVPQTASNLYNCHMFAWHNATPIYWMQNPERYWEDGSYKAVAVRSNGIIPSNLVLNGDRVRYVTGTGNSHSAVVYDKITNLLVSKWGNGPVVIHKPNESPYDPSFLIYYKSSNVAPQVNVGPGNGTYYIMNKNSKQFLDVSNTGTADGTQIWQSKFNGSNAQRWHLKDEGNGHSFAPAHVNTKRLDIQSQGNTNGSKVQIHANNNTVAQRYFIHAVSDENGTRYIKPTYSSTHRIEVKNGSTANQAIVQMYQFRSGNNLQYQQWEFLPVA